MTGDQSMALLGPTPFRHVSAWTARLVLLAVLGLVVTGVAQTSRRNLVERPGKGEDIVLYGEIVHDMRQGQSYYQATANRLREHGYAMTRVFNWRLPTLAWITAALPSDGAARTGLGAIALVTLLAWYAALRRTLRPGPAVALCIALLGIAAWPFLGEAYRVHETWAGLGIALSIATLSLGWTRTGVLAGLSALAVRELALPYVMLSVVIAVRAKRRKEAIAWLGGMVFFALAWAAHGWVVGHHQLPGDPPQPTTWLQLGGWWFVLKTALLNAWLITLPVGVTALVWPIALLGLLGWESSLGKRTAATAVGYAACFAVAGLTYNYLWGLVYAGLVPLGLFFAPAALRDLWRRAVRPNAAA